MYSGGHDGNFLDPQNLANHLSSENSTLYRNPATGFSICLGSLQSGLDVLQALSFDKYNGAVDAAGAPGLARAMLHPSAEPFRKAIKVLNTEGKAKALPHATVKAGVEDISNFFTSQPNLSQDFIRLATAASRLYTFAMAGLELSTVLQNKEASARGLSDGLTASDALANFKARPTDMETFKTLMAELYREKEAAALAWTGAANAAANIFGAAASSGTASSGEWTGSPAGTAAAATARPASAPVAKANSGVPPTDAFEIEEEDEDEAADDIAMEAKNMAYALWSKDAMERFLAQVMQAQATVSAKETRLTLPALKALCASVPIEVLALAKLDAKAAKIKELERNMTQKSHEDLYTKFIEMCSMASEHYAAEALAQAAAAPPAAEPEAEGTDAADK